MEAAAALTARQEAERVARARAAAAEESARGWTSMQWGSTTYKASTPSTYDAAAYGRQLDQQLRSVVNRPAWEPWHGSR
jgi:hypothetical protein